MLGIVVSSLSGHWLEKRCINATHLSTQAFYVQSTVLVAKAFSTGSDPELCFFTGALDEDVVVIEATPAPAPPVPASEEINVTSTDSEVEIVTVGDGFRYVLVQRSD